MIFDWREAARAAIATAVMVGALLLIMLASGAGHPHWINNGKYMDPVTGMHCCNEHDCKPLSEDDIALVTRLGDDLIVGGVRFRKGQQHNSEDGRWYRCANRCVFRPVEG